MVKNTGGPAILHKSLTLLCQVTGPVQNIQWWKDDQLISPNSNATSADNRTLTFNAVQRSDDGKYVCKAFNAVSNMSSSLFQVTVHCKNPIFSGYNVLNICYFKDKSTTLSWVIIEYVFLYLM